MKLKPGAALFAVNSSGRVFALCRDNAAWQELEYLGIEFKRVAAAKIVIWAIGGDHQIYVYVYGIEVPIRKEQAIIHLPSFNFDPTVPTSLGLVLT